MITKEGKIELIDQYLKKLGGEKYTYSNKITPDLNQEEIAEINFSISEINKKIQAVESEKIKIEQRK